MSEQYKQLTYEQRNHIYALKKSGMSQRKIAKQMTLSQSTISRELARNTGSRGYRVKQAHEKAIERRKEACKPTKMTPERIHQIEKKLRLNWSPECISGWLLETEQILLSHETIYRHVWQDKRAGGDLYTFLRRQGKKFDKRRNGKSTRGQIKNRVSIDERPDIVDQQTRVGDWEIDTVIGEHHQGALVTIVERKTKFTLSKQVMNKTAERVTQATIELLKPFTALVHTITADNGKEFAYHERISQALSAKVYFAHPYSSCERGLNENTNGLLRQYFPKRTNFKKVLQSQVENVVHLLNTRPRMLLDFKTPEFLMNQAMSKLMI